LFEKRRKKQMNPFPIIEKWISEHASAASLRDHVALLKEQLSALEKENVVLKHENTMLKEKISMLESEVNQLKTERDALLVKIKNYSQPMKHRVLTKINI